MSTTTDDRRSGRHPANVGHLVMGVAFLGLVGIWGLYEGDVIHGDNVRWLLPMPWVLAGLAGLLAIALSGRNRQPEPTYAAGWAEPTHRTGWIEPRYDAGTAVEPESVFEPVETPQPEPPAEPDDTPDDTPNDTSNDTLNDTNENNPEEKQ